MSKANSMKFFGESITKLDLFKQIKFLCLETEKHKFDFTRKNLLFL